MVLAIVAQLVERMARIAIGRGFESRRWQIFQKFDFWIFALYTTIQDEKYTPSKELMLHLRSPYARHICDLTWKNSEQYGKNVYKKIDDDWYLRS